MNDTNLLATEQNLKLNLELKAEDLKLYSTIYINMCVTNYFISFNINKADYYNFKIVLNQIPR